jgi:hypothetical protein
MSEIAPTPAGGQATHEQVSRTAERLARQSSYAHHTQNGTVHLEMHPLAGVMPCFGELGARIDRGSLHLPATMLAWIFFRPAGETCRAPRGQPVLRGAGREGDHLVLEGHVVVTGRVRVRAGTRHRRDVERAQPYGDRRVLRPRQIARGGAGRGGLPRSRTAAEGRSCVRCSRPGPASSCTRHQT